jgi:hypothetical protein
VVAVDLSAQRVDLDFSLFSPLMDVALLPTDERALVDVRVTFDIGVVRELVQQRQQRL